MIFRYVILSSIKKLQYERSVTAVYYLFQGKQSIQTIQDAHLFELTHYYSLYKQLSKTTFMNEIKALEQVGYLQQTHNENDYVLTEKANDWLKDKQYLAHEWYINGMKYHKLADSYTARLFLLIQVWTNEIKKHQSYIPIVEERETKQWIKRFYHQTKANISLYLQKLYEELYSIFQSLNPVYVEMFILQLTSYKHIGLTTTQIAQKYQLKTVDVDLIITSVDNNVLDKIERNIDQFPLLNELKLGLTQTSTLTHSASKTEALLLQGWSIEQIAMKRQLKINTIYDHIVEIAIQYEAFPLYDYMTKEQHKEITEADRKSKTYTLKKLKLMVNDNISYFQIRLVLSTLNHV